LNAGSLRSAQRRIKPQAPALESVRKPDHLANATVRTQLRGLEEKGAVKHRRHGKRFVYRPAVPRKSAAVSALRKVVETFFGGSVEDALATHLADPKTKLSDDEIKRLRRILNQHHPRGNKE
jgi:predicted transcriptional regulator